MLKDMLNWVLALASPVVFLATLIGTLIWSASSAVNNTYGRDIGWIVLLATVGYALAIVLLSFLGGGLPGDKRDYHEKKASCLFEGFLVKGAELAVFVVFYLWCAIVLSIVIGTIYAFLRGEDISQAVVQFAKVFIWGAVGVFVLTLGAIPLHHWDHLLRFIERGSSCDGYYHWFDDEQEEVGREKA